LTLAGWTFARVKKDFGPYQWVSEKKDNSPVLEEVA